MGTTEVDLELRKLFEQLRAGDDLSRADSRSLFTHIMSRDCPDTLTAAIIGALIVKGESVDQLVGAAEAMRAKMIRVDAGDKCVDTCGTGGDGISTFNVSTTAAIIAAAAGVTIAKHGNRSTTRVSGSTEVLTELGIDVDASLATVEQSIREVNIGYLNARLLHPAMKHAVAVRRAIPVRTIFNLLGPLTNPAGARRQVLGVPSEPLLELMGRALLLLGVEHAWVVHGGDGLCDLTITADTAVAEVKDGQLQRYTVRPEDAGLKRSELDALRVPSPQVSAEVVQAILRGAPGPQRDHALLNAGAAIVVGGRAETIGDGVALAADAVDSGAALDTFHHWRSIAGLHPPSHEAAERKT